MTVRDLLARLDSRELSEWMAFEQIDGPLGGRRGDIQAAIVASTVANVNLPRHKQRAPDDYLPVWDKPAAKSQQTPEEMWAAVKRANAQFGGTVIRG